MDVRKSNLEDLDDILNIYKYARKMMRKNGNPNQWRNTNPPKEVIVKDIEDGNHYIIENDNTICGVFSFIIGKDLTYEVIEGEWLNDELYGTIHRIASNGKYKGIFNTCLDYCEKMVVNLRIDTHEDNKIMQHLIENNGFEYCGIIHVQDGSPRRAYQKMIG